MATNLSTPEGWALGFAGELRPRIEPGLSDCKSDALYHYTTATHAEVKCNNGNTSNLYVDIVSSIIYRIILKKYQWI